MSDSNLIYNRLYIIFCQIIRCSSKMNPFKYNSLKINFFSFVEIFWPNILTIFSTLLICSFNLPISYHLSTGCSIFSYGCLEVQISFTELDIQRIFQ